MVGNWVSKGVGKAMLEVEVEDLSVAVFYSVVARGVVIGVLVAR
jgi:hypothetical protein